MYHRILIANRADCALRLIRACHEENIEAVVTAARDDDLEIIRKHADGVVFTGMSREAYTSQDDILEAARRNACEAILPGWGFLSEDFDFARKARLMGLHYIGPSSRHLQCFGDKLRTLQMFEDIVHPDYIPCNDPELADRVRTLSMPCMLKCRFGGAGKNIELIPDPDTLNQRLEKLSQTRENSRYYIEPAVLGARHIEFQVFGDGRGCVECLGVRDCTAQKRNQKWLELSLDLSNAPALLELSAQITRRLAQIQYASWGTVEFLVQSDGSRHLLEVNPRLQVEHGVTEMSSGIDIVRSAIRTSCFERLELVRTSQNSAPSVEFRLFARSTGTLERLEFDGFAWPHHPHESNPDYRLECAYQPGDSISGVYDGMLARFIVRDAADPLQKLREWLTGLHIEGIESNLGDLYI